MAVAIDQLLEEILPNVSKPGRYTGGELNAVTKERPSMRARVALAFPDVYEIGMSNLAISVLYHVVNMRDDLVAERVFAPWPDMRAAMRSAGLPLFSLESRTPLGEFDVVGFSLAFEMAYPTVLDMLDLANIPVLGADRDTGDFPLVLAGGHCCANPEPMAPFVDAFAIGEGEEVLIEVIDAWVASRGQPRGERLAGLSRLAGVYVPSLYTSRRLSSSGVRVEPVDASAPSQIHRRMIADVDSLPYPTAPVVPFIEAVHDRISLEVMRGCTRGCRFCQAGMITRPVREKSPECLMRQADELVSTTGHEEISLVSLSTTDHSRIGEIVDSLLTAHADARVGLALPSQRADQDCVSLLNRIQAVRKSGLTFAPEAGTQRLRDVINKNVTEDELLGAVGAAFSAGWRRVKLYFMIGLPTETDDDVRAIAELGCRVARLGKSMGATGLTVSLGVSTFVPKAHTPFQWAMQDRPDETRRKQTLLRSALRDRAVKVSFHDSRVTQVEAVLARGDRHVADAVMKAWQDGAQLQSWDEHFCYDRWLAAFAAADISPESIAHREWLQDEGLPWDHIDYGVSKAYLRAEARRASQGITTDDCHFGDCTFCQACSRASTEKRGTAGSRPVGDSDVSFTEGGL